MKPQQKQTKTQNKQNENKAIVKLEQTIWITGHKSIEFGIFIFQASCRGNKGKKKYN